METVNIVNYYLLLIIYCLHPMESHQFITKLWEQYTAVTPSAQLIYDLLIASGESAVRHDHIAFRTFNNEKICIGKLATGLLDIGYAEKSTYDFPENKLLAKHFEHLTDKSLPKIFISELKLEECSIQMQQFIKAIVHKIPANTDPLQLLFSGRLWGMPRYSVYGQLKEESEYAAWLYIYGFCVNHFAVYVNYLSNFIGLGEVNEFLRDNGFKLNKPGAEMKENAKKHLQQSGILADKIDVQFEEGVFKVSGGSYEFVQRFVQPGGELFQGFSILPADKIFKNDTKKILIETQ